MKGALSKSAGRHISRVDPKKHLREVQRLFLWGTPTYTSVTRTVIARGAFLVTALVSTAVIISITTRRTISTISRRANSRRWARCSRGFFCG